MSEKTIEINRAAIDQLTNAWPCHGIPDAVDLIRATYETNGALVDYGVLDASGAVVEVEPGGALTALLDHHTDEAD